jgi:alkanesulfonate monooxygenase SsuD/methylene tetrahydromethanopterin reductase-like flavin-dependent oxidoreductase (luciferase family)
MIMSSFGLTLANRGPIIGALKATELIDLAVEADRSGFFDAVWVGDSILAKPRLEAVALLGALAGATERVRLGVGCLATFVHRHPVLFAQQWASLDVLSQGRMWLVVCLGGPDKQSPSQALEHRVMGILSNERVPRLEEGIQLVRRLFQEDNITHDGRFYQFEGVTLQPKPVQNPCPIWIASNPTGITWQDGASASDAIIERNFRRVARYADGWQTNKVAPEQFREQWDWILRLVRKEGRDPAELGNSLYHNININEDRQTALEESKQFLDKYYFSDFSQGFVERWTTAGSPEACIEEFQAYFDAGVQHITLRLTSWDQMGQFKRFIEEVAPAFSQPA